MLDHLDLMYDQRSSLLDAIPTIGQAMLRLAGAFLTARDAASRRPLAADPRSGPSQGMPRSRTPTPRRTQRVRVTYLHWVLKTL